MSNAELAHGREGVAAARVQDLQTHLPGPRGVVLQHVKLLHCARVLVLKAVVEVTVDERALPDPRRSQEHQPDCVGTTGRRHADADLRAPERTAVCTDSKRPLAAAYTLCPPQALSYTSMCGYL